MITRPDQPDTIESESSALVSVIVAASLGYIVALVAFLSWYL